METWENSVSLLRTNHIMPLHLAGKKIGTNYSTQTRKNPNETEVLLAAPLTRLVMDWNRVPGMQACKDTSNGSSPFSSTSDALRSSHTGNRTTTGTEVELPASTVSAEFCQAGTIVSVHFYFYGRQTGSWTQEVQVTSGLTKQTSQRGTTWGIQSDSHTLGRQGTRVKQSRTHWK